MKRRYYIAYGSNLNKEQMQWRCPGAIPVAVGNLKDHRLVFQGELHRAHANVIPEKGQEVPVAIWEITERDEAALDRYEGVRGGYYTKETIQITIGGKKENALIYIMSPNDYGHPTDGYVECIVHGYEDFNLGIKALNEALVYSKERVGYWRTAR